MSISVLFKDRQDAGRQLAEQLLAYRDGNPIVLGLPRGGVVLGFEIARVLEAPLDVIVVRKIGAPHQPELGIGAVAPMGVTLLDQNTIEALRLDQGEVDQLAALERAEMNRRERHYRDDAPFPSLIGRTAIIADDGLATGVSARAAARAVRLMKARRVVVAVPVCAVETANFIREEEEVDELICLAMPEPFVAVGAWYAIFEQNTDDEVTAILEEARRSLPAP